MKTNMKTKILTAFIVLGMAGMASNAFATGAAYTISSGAYSSGQAIFSDPGAITSFISTDTGQANALLNGFGTTNSFTGVSTPNSGVNGIGTSSTNTPSTPPTFVPIGQIGNYAYASAAIPTIQTASAPTTTFISAKTIAEANVQAGNASQSAASVGSNSNITFSFGVSGSTNLVFSVNADPFLQAIVTSPNGIEAYANETASIKLVDTSTNVTMFDFTPNGATGHDVTGFGTYTVNSDPFSLNNNIDQLGSPGTLTYNPGTGLFEITDNGLTTGNYTLTLAVENNESTITSVPEPGTMLLMGAGLFGLGVFYRRKKA
jgi:hypothetical protein